LSDLWGGALIEKLLLVAVNGKRRA